MLQRSKEIKVKIEVLNKQDIVVDNIEGMSMGGSIDIKNDGLIRRNLDITFMTHDKTLISPNSSLWINKRLRVYLGIVSYSGDIEYFNYGIFIISNPELDIDENSSIISIKGYDKMYLYETPFLNKTLFTVGTPIGTIIRMLGQLIGETKFMIDDDNNTIPYDLQYEPDSDIENCLTDLKEMYMDYDLYYNAEGYLVYEKIKNRINDPIVWSFKDETDFHISKNVSYYYDNIKNYIKVIGALNEDTAEQPIYELSYNDKDNPFSIDNIGKKSAIFNMDKYTTIEQCTQKARYEMQKSLNLANTIDIQTIPLYIIYDANTIINVYDYNFNEEEKYLIDSISVPLDVEGQMGITAHKLFS
jgi:hypothetical protein